MVGHLLQKLQGQWLQQAATHIAVTQSPVAQSPGPTTSAVQHKTRAIVIVSTYASHRRPQQARTSSTYLVASAFVLQPLDCSC